MSVESIKEIIDKAYNFLKNWLKDRKLDNLILEGYIMGRTVNDNLRFYQNSGVCWEMTLEEKKQLEDQLRSELINIFRPLINIGFEVKIVPDYHLRNHAHHFRLDWAWMLF